MGTALQGDVPEILKLLGNPAILALVTALSVRDRSIGELSERTGLPIATVNYYLNRLRRRELIRTYRRGRTAIYTLLDRDGVLRDVLHSVLPLFINTGPDQDRIRSEVPPAKGSQSVASITTPHKASD